MNNHQTPTHSPTARYKAYAALLPLLDEPDVDADALAEVRSHLATCAYCQEQRAAYRRLETAALRYLSPPAAPRYRTEEIMRDLLGGPAAAVETEKPKPITTHPFPRRPASPRRLISSLAPLAAVLVIVILAVTLFASRARFLGPGTTSTPTPTLGTETDLLDVAMVSPTEGWAVGYSLPITLAQPTGTASPGGPIGIADLGHETVVMLHYARGTWTPVHIPLRGRLTRISMLSPTDGWAVGFEDNTLNGLFLHYDGHSWRQVAAGPMTSYGFSSLQMLSDTNGWATTGPVVHYDGHRWTAQPIPASLEPNKNYVLLHSVFMASPTEGWAVGFVQKPTPANPCPTATPTFTPLIPVTDAQGVISVPNMTREPLIDCSPPDDSLTGVILHYLNGQWSVYRLIPNAFLKDIVMTSPDDGWIAGSNEAGIGSPLLLHYTQGTWTQVPNPLSAAESRAVAFERIQMRSTTDGWIIIGTGVNFQKSATLRYDGTQWQVDRLPINPAHVALQIYSISMTSANDGWAVGSRVPENVNPSSPLASFTTAPLLLHYHNGTWNIVPTS